MNTSPNHLDLFEVSKFTKIPLICLYDMTEKPRFLVYLDIETAPLEKFRVEAQMGKYWNPSIRDSTKNKIITIQYQQLDPKTGDPVNELKILREWESSEKEIVKTFAKDMNLDSPSWYWDFRPVGNHLYFEWAHLTPKLEEYCGIKFDFTKLAYNMELAPTAILINNGEIKDSTRIFGKQHKAENMKNWYYDKEYDKIIEYIEDETKMFVDKFSEIYEYLKEFNDFEFGM